MPRLEIQVTGSSTVSHHAERGVLTLNVSSSGHSQETVFQEVKATTNSVQDLFKQLAPKDASGNPTDSAAITVFSTTSLRTRSWIPEDDDGKPIPPRQYSADVHFEAIFCDFAKLGEIMGSLFNTPHVEINGTEWRLTDATKASLGSQARKAAMWDAMAKARDYAEVVGREVFAVEILDQVANYARRTKQTARMAGTTSRVKSVSGIALEPEDVELCASVEVKFVGE